MIKKVEVLGKHWFDEVTHRRQCGLRRRGFGLSRVRHFAEWEKGKARDRREQRERHRNMHEQVHIQVWAAWF